MCLIAFAWQVHPRYPLVVAANRDEFHARPTLPLAAWEENPDIAGGRDLRAGGSWLGVRRGGRFAAVTNVRTPRLGPGVISRGALVGTFLLGSTCAPSMAARVVCEADRYGPFNLLLGDGAELVWATNSPTPAWHSVAPGVHGVSNGAPSFSDTVRPWPKVARLVTALRSWLESVDDAGQPVDVAPLFGALADERPVADEALPDTGVGCELERRLAPVFVRGTQYGTRCSSVVLVDAQGGAVLYERRFGAGGARAGDTRVELPPLCA